MNDFKLLYSKFEKFFASAKFAVIIITIFTVTLIYGTFMESYHGADYANRLVYKSWWFILIELLMFTSIVMATIVRLPYKKRLKGFYIIHSGLVILFIGSFFTYINGIDGSIQLLPNTPSRKILINEDILKISFINSNKVYTLGLPYTHNKKTLDKSIENITVKEFIPYAENQTKWLPINNSIGRQHGTKYQIFNNNMSQNFTLSLHSESDFKSLEKMGLLNLHYMPYILEECFLKKTSTGHIIWNLETGECFTPQERNIPVEKTDRGTTFIVMKYKNEYLKFFPDFSPVAVNDDLTKKNNMPFRVLSKNLFKEKPHLFLFGESVTYFNKRKNKWISKSLKNDNIAKLPWMGFKLKTIRHENHQYPIELPTYVTPIQDSNKIIKGNSKAVSILFQNKEYWVRDDSPLELTNGENTMRFQLTNKEIKLPYQITLQKFVMNKDPGTNNPASYESFTQLLDGRDGTKSIDNHIFMNNPLKYDNFTFYQSSYFEIAKDQYGSILSVNYDPGRFFKYLGSLFIVLGAIIHYFITRKKLKTKRA